MSAAISSIQSPSPALPRKPGTVMSMSAASGVTAVLLVRTTLSIASRARPGYGWTRLTVPLSSDGTGVVLSELGKSFWRNRFGRANRLATLRRGGLDPRDRDDRGAGGVAQAQDDPVAVEAAAVGQEVVGDDHGRRASSRADLLIVEHDLGTDDERAAQPDGLGDRVERDDAVLLQEL